MTKENDIMRWILIYFHFKYDGSWDDIFAALKVKEGVSVKQLQQVRKQVKTDNLECIVIIDNDYPQRCKKMEHPPFVIVFPLYQPKTKKYWN